MNAVTGYQAARLINMMFESDSIEKKIAPQMIYNYIRNGRIATVDGEIKNGKPQQLVEMSELANFYKKLKSGSIETKKKTEDLFDDFAALLSE